VVRYFFSKLGKSNSLADDYLHGITPIGCPAIPIFFDCTVSDRQRFIADRSGKEQADNFFWSEAHPSDAVIVAIHDGTLYLVRPNGSVVFWQCACEIGYAKSGQYVKLLPVEVVQKRRLSDVPGVLATMTANAYYYTGTFREISDWGVRRALQHVLDEPCDEVQTSKQLLLCLSSIEIETLIAKLLEEHGCFVPAYRGGALKGIDIFARNRSDKVVEVAGISIAPSARISIQVKRTSDLGEPPNGCDYLIVAERDADAILLSLRSSERTKSWLHESLSWAIDSFERFDGTIR
jgi:hypothetical protein